MPLNYSIAMLPNPMEKNDPHKAYAKAQINGELSLKELSKEVASKSTVHAADVYAVLIATTESMLTALKAGKQVNFGELGSSDSKSIARVRLPPKTFLWTISPVSPSSTCREKT